MIHADDRRRRIYLDFHVHSALALSSSICLYPHARLSTSCRSRPPEHDEYLRVCQPAFHRLALSRTTSPSTSPSSPREWNQRAGTTYASRLRRTSTLFEVFEAPAPRSCLSIFSECRNNVYNTNCALWLARLRYLCDFYEACYIHLHAARTAEEDECYRFPNRHRGA